LKLQKFMVSALFLVISMCAFESASAADESLARGNPGILIFSFSHGPETETQMAQGELKIVISAFENITAIHINGKEIDFNKDTKVDIGHPFKLLTGRNEFLVVVKTENETQQKRFVIHYGKKQKPQKSALQLIGLVNNSYLDNVTSVVDGGNEKSGSKISLTLVPIYNLYSGQFSELKIKGIVLREKFSAKAFSSNEVSYTKMALEWKNKNTFLGEIKAEAGINDVRTDNNNPLLGEDESISEYYASGMMARKLGQKFKWDMKLEYKVKDSKAEFTNLNNDADAAVSAMNARFHFKLSGFKGTGKLGYKTNDAKGKYKDSSTSKLGFNASYPFEQYTPALGYDTKLTAMKIADPFNGNIKQEDMTSVITLKLGYQIFKTSHIAFKLKYKQQTSNVATSEYSAKETILSYTHVF